MPVGWDSRVLLWTIIILLFASPTTIYADEKSDCSAIHLLVDRLSKSPTALRGGFLGGGLYQSTTPLSGARQCTYGLESGSQYTIECTWLARSYQVGESIFNQIAASIRACTFLSEFKLDATLPNGEQKATAYYGPADRPSQIYISLHHASATIYSDIASREITLAFLRDVE
jgi:hypothetical protein